MASATTELLCYNKGCGNKFLTEENGPEACIHHPGGPIFHEGYKGWSCCKKRTTDFTEFLNIPGCTKGIHNPDKPPEVSRQTPVVSSDYNGGDNEVLEVEALRQRKPIEQAQRPSCDQPMTVLPIIVGSSLKSALAKLSLNKKEETQCNKDINKVEMGTPCKNKGCQKEYLGEDSNNEICSYHPGVAIFHEGMKYWSCCERKTSDFNNFLDQEGCAKGKHLWVLSEEDAKKVVSCRHDWHQTGSLVVLSIYCKNSDPEKTVIEANQVCLNVTVTFNEGQSQFKKRMVLEGPIDPLNSKVNMLGTKVEVKLKKSELFSWKQYEVQPVGEIKSAEELEELEDELLQLS